MKIISTEKTFSIYNDDDSLKLMLPKNGIKVIGQSNSIILTEKINDRNPNDADSIEITPEGISEINGTAFSGSVADLVSAIEDLLFKYGGGSGVGLQSGVGSTSPPIIYEDIKDAVDAGVALVLGSPATDFISHNSPTAWNYRRIYKYGGNNEADGNGLELLIPNGYDTAWIRVLGDRWNVIKCYMLDGASEQLGHFGGGYRNTRNYQPDGGMRKRTHTKHEWIPIAVGRSGRLALISKPNTNANLWVSGIAFTKNKFNLVTKSAIIAYWNCDPAGGTQYAGNTSGVRWHSHNWKGDHLAYVQKNTTGSIMLPVIPNGKDKAIYLVSHNNTWDEIFPEKIKVDGTEVEVAWEHRDSPISWWWSKTNYGRVICCKIDKSLIGNNHLIQVDFIHNPASAALYFREVGSYDWV